MEEKPVLSTPNQKQNSEGNESPSSKKVPLIRSLSAGEKNKNGSALDKSKINIDLAPRTDSLESLLSPREKVEKSPPVLKKRNTMATPMRFVDIVPLNILESLSAREIRKQEVIFEIINTERQYVRDLNLLIENFLNPIREKQILSKSEINTIFSNVEVIRTVNSCLVSDFDDLKKQGLIIETIGDVFVNNIKKFKSYTTYCSNQRIGATLLHELEKTNQNFKKFLTTNPKKAVCRGLSIADFLILPLQRLCKYPLLINNLLECTTEDHHDHKNLEKAQVLIKKLVSKVNERTKEVDNAEKVSQIQKKYFSLSTPRVDLLSEKRAFIREGNVTVEDKSFVIILFDDSLLVFRQKSTKLDYQFPLVQITLSVVSQSSFDVIGEGKILVQLTFKDKNEAERWRSVILRNQQLKEKVRKKSKEKAGLSDNSDLSESEKESDARSDRESDRESDPDRDRIKSRFSFFASDKKQKSLVINQFRKQSLAEKSLSDESIDVTNKEEEIRSDTKLKPDNNNNRNSKNNLSELDDKISSRAEKRNSKSSVKEKDGINTDTKSDSKSETRSSKEDNQVKEDGKEGEKKGGSRRSKRNSSDKLNVNSNLYKNMTINHGSAVFVNKSLTSSNDSQTEVFNVIKDRIAQIKRSLEKLSEAEKVKELFKLLVDEITTSTELRLSLPKEEKKTKNDKGKGGALSALSAFAPLYSKTSSSNVTFDPEPMEGGRSRSSTTSRTSSRTSTLPLNIPSLKFSDLPKSESTGRVSLTSSSGAKSARSHSITHSAKMQLTLPLKNLSTSDEDKNVVKKVVIPSLNLDVDREEEVPVKKKKIQSLTARGKRKDVIFNVDFSNFTAPKSPGEKVSSETVNVSEYQKVKSKLDDYIKENEKLKAKLLSVQNATKKYESKIASICS